MRLLSVVDSSRISIIIQNASDVTISLTMANAISPQTFKFNLTSFDENNIGMNNIFFVYRLFVVLMLIEADRDYDRAAIRESVTDESQHIAIVTQNRLKSIIALFAVQM